MSIVPINSEQAIIATTPNNSSDPINWEWDPLFNNFFEDFRSSLDLIWEPSFTDFPFHFPSFPGLLFPSHQTQINCKETSKAHVFKAILPGFTEDQVIVYIDEERVLQISTDDGKFMSRFKLPDNAVTDQVKASMRHGLLTVSVPKQTPLPTTSGVRVVEITGD